ncbi:MAG: type IV secretory system conjugative DNA transfer family protein [Lachnospiraceae bacterium]|nr:type IV secretory system conjugative DNA transfer family protein [Lachnospiraceae bacterium]
MSTPIEDLQKVTKDYKRKLRLLKKNPKKIFIAVFPYIMFGYFADKIGFAYRITHNPNLFQRILGCLMNLNVAFATLMPSFNPHDLLFGVTGGIIFKLIVYFKGKNRKKYRHGEEYGSARWGTAKDVEPFMDMEDPLNNVILTQTEGLQMNGRPSSPKYARNKNILVIGGSGAGKTRFFIKPNIMQMHSSYVVTDPKGTVLVEVGKMLKDNGYVIKVINTINFKKSMHYNPFAYLHSEKDILKLVNTLIVNTKGEGDKSGEDFWVKAERLLYTAYIGFIFYEADEESQNFEALIDMINASETREDDETFKNAIDLAFDELEARDPEHFAVKQYKKYKLAAGKTAKSILISCGARLAPFDIKELRELTHDDQMELDLIGDRKTALFMIMSDTDSTFNFILALMQSQLFNLLCERADDVYHGRLPVHVRCLLDEFANIGQIPQFDKLIATIRSREISASIVLQSKSQLKTLYKDAADTIEGNCDTMLFLGGKEKSTLKDLAEILGKTTIDLYNTSDTRGTSQTYGTNFQKTGRELMSQDEIAVMDGGKCIMQIRGVRPFLSDKFDITKHNQYKNLSDDNPKNAFDIEKELTGEKKLVLRKHDLVTYLDCSNVAAR